MEYKMEFSREKWNGLTRCVIQLKLESDKSVLYDITDAEKHLKDHRENLIA
jgi:hypothetical protein